MLEIIAIVLLVVLDQAVKLLVRANIPLGGHVAFIPGFLDFTYLQNDGAAFSILEGARWFFVLLTVAFIVFAIWVLVKKKLLHPIGTWSWVLVVAGAAGNLIDRAAFGYVTDMIETLFMNFPVFNVADICVVVGGIVFCIYYAFLHDKLKAAKAEKPDAVPETAAQDLPSEEEA